MGKASPSAKPLKAYSVMEGCEGTGGIVFARHGITARRQGANEFADGDFYNVRCNRAPWADQFAADGDVPIAAMVEAGWHFECGGCGFRIDSDMLWERDLMPSDLVGTQGTAVYCTAVCEAREALRRAEAGHRERRWIRRFRKFVLARFPTAKLVAGEGISKGGHAYADYRNGRWSLLHVSVQFGFPGMSIAPAVLRYDRLDWRARTEKRTPKPHFEVCAGDRAAFEAWAATQPRPEGARAAA